MKTLLSIVIVLLLLLMSSLPCPAPSCKETRPTAQSLADHTAQCHLAQAEKEQALMGMRTRHRARMLDVPSSTPSPSRTAGANTEGTIEPMDVDDDTNWATVKEHIPSGSTAPKGPRRSRRIPKKINDLIPDIQSSTLPASTSRTSRATAAQTSAPAPAALVPPPKPGLSATETNKFGIFKVWRKYPFAPPPPPDDGFVSDIPTFLKPDADEKSAWWKGFGRLRDGLSGASVDTVCGPLMNSSVFRLVRYYYQTIHDRSVQGFNSFVRNVLKAKDFNLDDVPANFDLRKECKKLDEHDDTASPFMHSAAWHEATVRFPMSCEREKFSSEERAPQLEVDQVLHRRLIEVIKSALEGPDSATYQYTPTQTYWKPGPGIKEERVFSELFNSDAFWAEHEKVLDAEMAKRGQLDMPTAIIGMQLYSDSTHLANFGTAALWPFYLYIGNQSKYERGKPNQYAAHHLAYIPVLPSDLQEKYMAEFKDKAASAPTITQLKRELVQAIWRHLLQDPEFLEAYKNGIVIKCFDGVTRRFFPRFFTYSADYPEKVLMTSIKFLARCGCPSCFTEKEYFHELGTKNDGHRRDRKRQDDEDYRKRIKKTRDRIFKKGIGVTGKGVENVLESRSEVPIRNAFSETLSPFGFNFYSMFVPDLLHEFELGVWKAIFSHLIRILYTAPGNLVQILNQRYRLVPTYGRGVIRRFSNNASGMKKMAARDFEDLLQCALPVFEGLLAEHDSVVLDMLFVLCCWHAYGKLRLHTSRTVNSFSLVTRALGMNVRKFRSQVCSKFITRNLPSEEAARSRQRQRRQAKAKEAKKGKAGAGDEEEDEAPSTTKAPPKVRLLNLSTFKFHNLGHYVRSILQFGTTDNYSTQSGEQEHRRVKQFYVHTNKMRAFGRQIARHYRRQRLLQAITVRYELAKMTSATKPKPTVPAKATVASGQPDPLPPGSPTTRYQISASCDYPIDLDDWLFKHKDDPALTNFFDDLRAFILARLTLPREERSDAEFDDNDLNRIIFDKGRIYAHKVLRTNYTTYDMQRQQDSTNPNTTHCDVMFHSHEADDPGPGLKPHKYWYGRLCGIYHADITLLNKAGIPEKKDKVDFLWVRWFGRPTRDENNKLIRGLEEGRLQRCGFIDTDIEDSGAFGFVGPADVIRSVHMIPVFSKGTTDEYMGKSIARHPREKDLDYVYYDVNIFSDRDMFMRFCGGGPGHGPREGKYSLDPDSLYAKKTNTRKTAPEAARSSASVEDDIEMGDVSEAESEEFLAAGDIEEEDEALLAAEKEDYGYTDPDEVIDVSDEEEGEGEVDDILKEDGDIDAEEDLGPEGPDDEGLHEDEVAGLGYSTY